VCGPAGSGCLPQAVIAACTLSDRCIRDLHACIQSKRCNIYYIRPNSRPLAAIIRFIRWLIVIR